MHIHERAARADHEAVLELLRRSSSSANTADELGALPLHRAATAHDALEVLTVLLQHPDVDVDSLDSTGCTSLHYAAQTSHVANVSILLDFGADVSSKNNELEEPLAIAVKMNCINVIQQLLEFCADVEARDCDNCTPLMLALMEDCSLDVIEVLLHEGANPNAIDRFGVSVLGYARTKEAVYALVEAGADVNYTCDSGTALHRAAFENNTEVIRALLELGCDAKVVSTEGLTALDFATKRRCIEITIKGLQ